MFLVDTYTCPVFGATGSPILNLWWRLLRISKRALPYSHFRGKLNLHYPRYTSGTTPANFLTASIVARSLPTYMFQQWQDAKLE